MSSTSALWHDARHPPKNPTDISFKDKAVLVTGAHGSGLGHHAAIKYATLGANPLILAARTRERGKAAKKTAIIHDTPSGEYEMSLKVDVLSHGLLALLLLPKLHETAMTPDDASSFRPHLSFLDSIAIFEVPEDILPPYPRPKSQAVDDSSVSYQTIIQRLDDAKKWNPIHQYFLIKLATWYIVKGVADLVTNSDKFSGVIVNATCPGLCNTNMTSGLPLAYRAFMAIRYFFLGRTAEMGARTLVSATA
ncbi:putative short-chain dehydrogenase reductase protein [Rhypophila sp. PSN 637]